MLNAPWTWGWAKQKAKKWRHIQICREAQVCLSIGLRRLGRNEEGGGPLGFVVGYRVPVWIRLALLAGTRVKALDSSIPDFDRREVIEWTAVHGFLACIMQECRANDSLDLILTKV